MNAKQWLMRARTLDAEIAEINDDIKKELAKRKAIYDLLTSATQSYSGETVQSSKDPHKFDKIAEYETNLDNLIDKLVDRNTELLKVKAETESAIFKLTDGRYREILRLRYLSGKTFEEIAVAIRYSHKQTCRLHGRALLKMEEIING